MERFKKILVVCPSNTVTGGPEALHQLVAHMRDLGLNAYIVYLPFDRFAVTPPQYRKYEAPVGAYEDNEGDLIIFPEVFPMLALKVHKAQAALWWLSLENFLERRHVSVLRDKFRYFKKCLKGERPFFGATTLKKLIHFSQTEHSTQYLRLCGIEPVPLIDSINEDFLTDKYLHNWAHKDNVILYNPGKGKKITSQLIAQNPQWTFIPLKGLSPEEMSKVLYSAKLYIDFGHHPGRDRLPREAAMHGCCLITGRLGSAGNSVDLPINDQYKLDTLNVNFFEKFKLLAQDVFTNFDKHNEHFVSYRQWLKSEPIVFKKQIADFFLKNNQLKPTIFVVTHIDAQKEFPVNYEYFYVGGLSGKYSDTVEDNIGELNPFFCELTALYWIWKNYDTSSEEIVGLCHYRRFFSNETLLDIFFKKPLEMTEATFYLSECDLIIPQRTFIVDGLYRHYAGSHVIEDMDLMLKIIATQKNLNLDDLKSYLVNENWLAPFNMFISKKSILDAYCDWAFPVLFEVFKTINLVDRSTHQKRAIGFLAERLFNIWLWFNQDLKVKELPISCLHKSGISNLNRYKKDQTIRLANEKL
jgi:Domain of unknown function (DUF4422)